MELKNVNPDLKMHLAVGGWTMGTGPFETITASNSNMVTFAENSATFLRQHGFDGLDLDWEYPGAGHKTKFSDLTRVLFEKYSEEAQQSGKPRLLITAAVAGHKPEIERSYEPGVISQ